MQNLFILFILKNQFLWVAVPLPILCLSIDLIDIEAITKRLTSFIERNNWKYKNAIKIVWENTAWI